MIDGGDASNGDSASEDIEDFEERLESFAPLMNLLDRARDAVVGPARNASGEVQVEPPHQLGDFELLSPIGRGGMGVVYEARQKSLDRIVAIKVLPKSVLPEAMDDSDSQSEDRLNLVQRFHTEARAAARLHHPNIVPVFGFGEADGFYYFVMQRIYGQGLDRWIQSNVNAEPEEKVSESTLWQTVAQFGQQAAAGLEYAHQQGVLHRDIKPANLLVDEDHKVQIADFGVARIEDADALTKTSDVIGTLRYMAPEQISGESQVQSDVYSLGITLYELVTGQPAVDDASVRNAILLHKTPRGPVPLALLCPTIPVDLKTVIEKAMDPELTHRYLDASSLADDLDRFLEGRSIKARPLPWWEKSSRWVRRNRTVTLLASLLMIAMAAAAIGAMASQRRISASFDETMIAKRAADRTALLATSAMEEIFERFASSADSNSIVYEATDFSAPPVDRKTAALLEELIGYYIVLAKEADNNHNDIVGTGLRPGEARMRLGTIQQQLGNHTDAIKVFYEALSELRESEVLLRARALNQIGIAHEVLGQDDRSKPMHADAIAILESIEQNQDRPEVRFERARSELLLARQLRPGSGPNSLTPRDAFRHDLFRPDPGRPDHRPGEFGRPERGPGDFPRRGPPPPPHPMPRDSAPPRRPRGHQRTPPASDSSSEDLQYDRAINEMLQLRKDDPASIPVTLLLSNLVRQAIGDILRTYENPGEKRWLLELSEELEHDLAGKMETDGFRGNDAAIAFELVHLLTDFNVFHNLRESTLTQGIDRLNRALEVSEYLVSHYPNVPAYESLAVHTAFKAASLKTVQFANDPQPSSDAVRSVRTLLRQALRREMALLERTPDGYGYSLWCSLFLTRIGDLQMRTHEREDAVRSYRRALRILPLKMINAHEADDAAGGSGFDVLNIQASSSIIEDVRSETMRATAIVLHRFSRAVRESDDEASANANRLAQQIEDGIQLDPVQIEAEFDAWLEP